DDVPEAADGTKMLDNVTSKFNVLLTIDISGSMRGDSGVPNPNSPGNNYSKLELEGVAIHDLLDQYVAAAGGKAANVMVNTATFSTDSNVPSTTWMTVAQAEAMVDQIVAAGPGGQTNYHDALTAAQTAFNEPGKLDGATNVSYFTSDGQPNEPNIAN